MLPSIDLKVAATAAMVAILDEGDFTVSPEIEAFRMLCTVRGDPEQGVAIVAASDKEKAVRVALKKSYAARVSWYENNPAIIDLAMSVSPKICAKLRRARGGKSTSSKKLTTLDLRGTEFGVVFDETCAVRCGDFAVNLPRDATVSVVVSNAILNVSGLGQCRTAISWNFRSAPTIASTIPERSVGMLPPELLKGSMRASIDIVGGVTISVQDGSPHLAVLLDPSKYPDRLLATIDALSIPSTIISIADVIHPEFAETLRAVHGEVARARDMLKTLGIHSIKQAIPKDVVAKVASRMLNADEAEVLDEVISPIIAGKRFSVRRVKQLLEPFLEEKLHLENYAYELDRWCRWVREILAPGSQRPPNVSRDASLAFPDGPAPITANDIQGGNVDPELALRAAPYMRLEQVEYLCKRMKRDASCTEYQRRVLRYIVAIKRRTMLIGDSSSATPMQTQMISFFLGVALRVSTEAGSDPLHHSILGPADYSIPPPRIPRCCRPGTRRKKCHFASQITLSQGRIFRCGRFSGVGRR